ncbi:MAG: arginyl-tRNA synthetase [Bacteroidia bacterium]|jgi:arginyl-tRNA synthetase
MTQELLNRIPEAIELLFGKTPNENQVQLQKTRKEFEGDVTLVVFPLLKLAGGAPEAVGTKIGEWLVENIEQVVGFNVVKGFLNISYSSEYWITELGSMTGVENFGFRAKGNHSRNIMVESASPNTNKPLHLGHIRNILLGHSVAEILKANGHEVKKVQIVNDRGIHICKSMLAWQKWGNGDTPDSTGIKGDKLVGDYYVQFEQAYKKQIAELIDLGKTEKEAKQEASMIVEAREMLRKWEAEDAEVLEIWRTMNGWVYKGFDVTYENLGVDFDKLYYESDTFKVGRDKVNLGLEKGMFTQHKDNSIWVDLTDKGLDEKLLMRADGTTVYMTQDIGTAILRNEDWPELNQLIYTVGNEQDYHFKVLFQILEKLGYEWAQNCYHLSYGMVELPDGKMKSREGTAVDADDLMAEMIKTAKENSQDRGKLEELSEEEANTLFELIGMGALKYFMLKVDPKKRMVFNPAESIDMQGNTGPFIQYTHARIRSVLRKMDVNSDSISGLELSDKERGLIRLISQFPDAIKDAGDQYDPSGLANYTYELAKEYNQFYHDHHIMKEEDVQKQQLRLRISKMAAQVISTSMKLIGVDVPERM